LYKVTTGISNAALGDVAGDAITTGNQNVALGSSALGAVTTGSSNVGIGQNSAGGSLTTGSNNITIGQNSGGDAMRALQASTSNNIVIGSNTHTVAYIKIDWTVTSDERDKMNFEEVPHGLDFVNQLKPVSFVFKKSREDATPHGFEKYGFKAQDILALEKANGGKNIIINDENDEALKVTNSHMTPVLVNAIQELTKRIEELEKK